MENVSIYPFKKFQTIDIPSMTLYCLVMAKMQSLCSNTKEWTKLLFAHIYVLYIMHVGTVVVEVDVAIIGRYPLWTAV